MLRRILCLLPLFAATLALARDKPQNWIEVRSPHFVVVSNAGEKQIRHVADQFERMRSVFHTLFPKLQIDPGSPIVVIATKDEKDFRSLEPQDYLGKGKLQLAGLFLRAPDKNYVLMRLDAEGEHPYATIYHEYTHLLVSKDEEWLPLWFDEGLAEYFQNTDIRDKEVVLGEPDSENLALLRQNRLLPLATLLTVDHTSPYYHEQDKGSIFYAESWALTHYLEIKDYKERSNRLSDYVGLVSQKVDAVTAATRAFGDLRQLQQALDRYVGQNLFTDFKMANPGQVDDSTFQAKALIPVQADAVRADFLAYNNRTADAHVLLDEVLREDPNNVSAHETMGFLAFRDGHLDEARKWYAEAVKLDSQSYLAHYYFAAMSMNAGSLNGEDEAQVESSLRAAIQLNPTFAPPYDRLAAFYGVRRRNLDEAHMLCLQAAQLDPSDLSYRLNCANILMTMGRSKDAVTVIQNALPLAKSPPELARAHAFLEQAKNFETARERMDADNKAQGGDGQPTVSVTETSGTVAESNSEQPVFLHREETPPHGPHRSLTGKIKNVHCDTPAILDFVFASGGQVMPLHSGNFYKVPFTTLNFTPEGDLQPCTQIEGMNAKVEFVEPVDKTVKRWIVRVELRK